MKISKDSKYGYPLIQEYKYIKIKNIYTIIILWIGIYLTVFRTCSIILLEIFFIIFLIYNAYVYHVLIFKYITKYIKSVNK